MMMIDFLIVEANDDEDVDEIFFDNYRRYERILHEEYEFVLGAFKINKKLFQIYFKEKSKTNSFIMIVVNTSWSWLCPRCID